MLLYLNKASNTDVWKTDGKNDKKSGQSQA